MEEFDPDDECLEVNSDLQSLLEFGQMEMDNLFTQTNIELPSSSDEDNDDSS